MHPLLIFILSMAITIGLIPLLMRLAKPLQVIDEPGSRKVHAAAVPRVGGIAMFIGTFLPLSLGLEIDRQVLSYLIAGGVIFLFGFWDDRRALSPIAKLLGQLVAVLVVMYAGNLRIAEITLADRTTLPDFIAVPLTVFLLLGATNAINLADGLDGLAGGTTLLCCVALFLLAWSPGLTGVATVAVALAGSILGFLRFNTHPARVFMGDAGSQFLGFSTAVLAIKVTQSPGVVYATALPVLLLGLPVVDTLTVMLQRLREGHSPFIADRKHLHHKLLALRFDHHEAVVVIYMVQGAFFLATWFTRFASDMVVLSTFAVLAGGVVGLMMIAGRMDWRWRPPVLHWPGQNGGRSSWLANGITWLSVQSRLPRWTVLITSVCIAGYLLGVAVLAQPANVELRWLSGGVSALGIVGLSLERRHASFDWILHGALYMSAILAVYLDFQTPHATEMLYLMKWVFLPPLVISVAVGMRLAPERRFTMTTLDVLLIFLVIALPNLPGLASSPAHMGISLGKLVALLYGIEQCVDQSRPLPRPLGLAMVIFCVVVMVRPLVH